MIVLSQIQQDAKGRYVCPAVFDFQVRLEQSGSQCTGCGHKFKAEAAARFVQDPRDRKTGKMPGVKLLCRVCYPKHKGAK